MRTFQMASSQSHDLVVRKPVAAIPQQPHSPERLVVDFETLGKLVFREQVCRVETPDQLGGANSPRRQLNACFVSPRGRTEGQNGSTFAQDAKPANWRKHCGSGFTTFGEPKTEYGQIESEKI